MGSRVLVSIRVKATPQRAFEAFTRDIGLWWKPNGLFAFTPRSPGRMAFEGEVGGHLVETLDNGMVFQIGEISDWKPGEFLAFGWRQASFEQDQSTRVEVSFEAVGEETRVTINHLGWDSVPPEHVARHGFPDGVFLRRHGEWWQGLLASMRETL
ncbi:MAG: ATPase [Caulobacteraceae bacterium]|jgi:uncharacterized protein YndB with AHSA1/START domain|nr:ATPase [Caulobacteraceae bacterium]